MGAGERPCSHDLVHFTLMSSLADTMSFSVLIAVYRGKMSEGISFNDNNARGVICVGLPLPSAFALPIKIKMHVS